MLPRRRIVLALSAVAVAACYVTRVSDEDRVAEYAAKQMDCDPSLVRLESVGANDDTIARYAAHGCGQSRTFDCTQEGENVVCHLTRTGTSSPSDGTKGDPAGSVLAGVIVGSACACAHAASGSHSSAPAAPKSGPNVNPSDPVRSK